MSAALALPKLSESIGQLKKSAGRTRLEIVPNPPEPHTWEERHCPDCGLLEPHHTTRCIWRD
jgi:hypothetical protein